MDEARFYWMKHFHNEISIITSQKKIQSARYDKFSQRQDGQDVTYNNLLNELDQEIVNKTYQAIDDQITESEIYIQEWLNYQSLWEIDAEAQIYDRIGDDIQKWQRLMSAIKVGRKTFDNSETEKFFGPIEIIYSLVQLKINNKYDAWHKEILNKFAATLNSNMLEFHNELLKKR